jgi:hypothetical protein
MKAILHLEIVVNMESPEDMEEVVDRLVHHSTFAHASRVYCELNDNKYILKDRYTGYYGFVCQTKNKVVYEHNQTTS